MTHHSSITTPRAGIHLPGRIKDKLITILVKLLSDRNDQTEIENASHKQKMTPRRYFNYDDTKIATPSILQASTDSS